jgi:hypothetical protein
VGTRSKLIIGASSSSFEHSADHAQVVLQFTVPVPGAYSLEIEQSWWHGNAASTESKVERFQFVPTGQYDYPGKTESGKHWSAFLDTGCLRLAGSPFQVQVEEASGSTHPKTKATAHRPNLGDAGARKHGPDRACSIVDLEQPGQVYTFLISSFCGEM